ncbi:MAG: glutamine-hydrolyzing carbamoyl-phosphate synthase small subunit [Planctomycetes bacterium]|nr:glutamine-hydrolyzing carbamoyl-phosphate synthase small subunit [Planctomycetota bacterium]
MTDPALLVLEDGRAFRGRAFGHRGETTGEVVFNTSLTGYQEVLTDPSYAGQIVVMTCPHIGNYGVNEADAESRGLFLRGFVVRECTRLPSNFRSEASLETYLLRHRVPGIDGVDTRALTRHLREVGAQRGVISSTDLDPGSLRRKAENSPPMQGTDFVREVSIRKSEPWTSGRNTPFSFQFPPPPGGDAPLVAAMDFGMKHHILRSLVEQGFRVARVPATATAGEVLALRPDGVFLSNGPGDPAALPYIFDTVVKMVGKVPMFGICLGHQILGHVFGGRTFKLKFGHHGSNQPVLDLTTGKVEITAQNHGFAVDAESLPAEVKVTHVNLNDRTVEGLAHTSLPIFSVQYHPEASPGPHDSMYLFQRFRALVDREREKAATPFPR